MDGLALVELEPALVADLNDAQVLVGRLLLEDDLLAAGARLRHPRREHQQGAEGGGDEERAPRQPRHGRGQGEDRGEPDEGPLRPDRGDQHERGEEDTDEASDGGHRVQPAGHLAGALDGGDGEADRPGRDRAEQQHRQGDEHQHGDEGADEGTGVDVVERAHGGVQEWSGDEGHHGQERGGREHREPQAALVRMPIGGAAAEPVADRQGDEHDADGVRPDDRRGPEVGGQQAGGGDLRAQAGGASDEDEGEQRGQRAPLGHPGRHARLGRRWGLERPAWLHVATIVR